MKPLAYLFTLLLALPAAAIEQFDYRVLERKPQSRTNFVQGLEIHDGKLYLSSGLYGQSRLAVYDFDSGELLKQLKLPAQLFAEGLTLHGKRLYQLTWRSGMVLVYNSENLDFEHWFRIPGEGWGLTHNGQHLIYSDGSDKLHFIDPEKEQIIASLSVVEAGQPVSRLNELEWIEGRIWANIWQQDRIVIINPDTGEVEASINLVGLLPALERRRDTDVLNGIARDPADGSIWLTGKRWPWLYQIELLPR